MKSTTLKSDILLLLTAAIWGFAFVAQRLGMDHVGPFTFNGIRFALGSLALVPLMLFNARTTSVRGDRKPSATENRMLLIGGPLAGLAIFTGASLQQVGLVYTTAGKAGFITGLYVVIVPMIGFFIHQRTGVATWIGAILAATGLYFLSVNEAFTVAYGDMLELIGAFFWALHVIILGRLSPVISAIRLAFFQFASCSILSLLTAFLIETITLEGIIGAGVPILYGGLMSVGIAYTLQVVAQKEADPSHAAIILSLEGVFAAIGGWLMLNEFLSVRSVLGCALMLSGMLISQLQFYFSIDRHGIKRQRFSSA